jgi:hypothetical protein
LTTKLLFRRLSVKRNSIRRNNKGVSTIFGMVFFLLIVVIIFASFAVILNQSTSLEATMIQSRQMDLDKSNELLVLKGVSDDYFLINNTGTLSAQVVRLWVQDSSGNSNSWTVPLAQQAILPNQEKQYGPMSGATNKFRYWFITARGNQFSYLVQGGKGQDGINGIDGKNGNDGKATVANGIGYLAFDFESVTYFTVVNNQLTPYPSGIRSYTMPVVNNLAIGFNVTNMNMDYNITLDPLTNMWSYFSGVPGHTLGPVWKIVGNQSATVKPNTPITLVSNQTTFIIYALQAGTVDQQQKNNIAAINLLFFGDLTTYHNGVTTVVHSYGQNVPFVSIKFVG